MSGHPEVDGELGELINFVESQELIDVWCNGCEAFRKANGAYGKYLKGEINSCRFCLKNKIN